MTVTALSIVLWGMLVLAFVASCVRWWRAPYGFERDGWRAPMIAFGVLSVTPIAFLALCYLTGGDA